MTDTREEHAMPYTGPERRRGHGGRDAFTREDRRTLGRILDVLLINTRQGVAIMATQAELQAKVDAAAAGVQRNTDLLSSVEAAEAVQIQLIKDLRDQLAAGGTVPDEVLAQLDNVIAVAEANSARLAALAVENTPQA